jgi:endonuclease G, mitochondrial
MSNVPGLRQRRLKAAQEAANRWAARTAPRGETIRSAAEGKPLDTPERRSLFLSREARRAGQHRFVERIIGLTADFQPFAPDEDARKAGRPVARIVSQLAPEFEPEGFATGFMVTPRLLLTNHHVFPLGQDPGPVKAQFFYEQTSNGVSRGVFHTINLRRFHMADETLDYALVAVDNDEKSQQSLDSIGFIGMVPTSGKVLIGHPMNIIQHPAGRPKQYATTENKLLDVLDAGFLHYTTDTLQGSSGSPVFNYAWEVVALHHSGVPLVIDGLVRRRDGKPWNDSMSDDDVQWIANEGSRVSSIVKSVTNNAGKGPLKNAEAEKLRQEFLEICARSDERAVATASGSSVAPPNNDEARTPPAVVIDNTTVGARSAPGTRGEAIVIQINPTITVNGVGMTGTPAADKSGELAVTAATKSAEKAIRFDTNYKRKKGYDSKFLGVDIPLPDVARPRIKEMWKSDTEKPAAPYTILKYHHYSLAMNRDRQTCMWTAANVDYTPSRRSKKTRDAFGEDKWIPDPRVPVEFQIIDEEFYRPATKVDRGHIVRRDDACWGDTDLAIEFANSDTFHYTNCTVQHEAFNKSQLGGLWGRFENFITREIDSVGMKASVFAGPVLSKDDPSHDYGLGSVQYPLKFWKIVAAVSTKFGGKLFVTGFVLDQKAVVDAKGLAKVERIDFSPWKSHRRTLKQITEMTGVTFPKVLLDADTPA